MKGNNHQTERGQAKDPSPPLIPRRRWRRRVVQSSWRLAAALAVGTLLVVIGLVEGVSVGQIVIGAGGFSLVLWIFLVTYIS